MKTMIKISTFFASLILLAACSDSSDMNMAAPNDDAINEMSHDHMETENQANVFIVSPVDGATVTSPVKVVFGLEGMEISPAGTGPENSGHHHLIVDGELPELDKPMGGDVTHFGKGQTETTLELAPGEHTLQLIMGNKFHQPHDNPVISKKITITVK